MLGFLAFETKEFDGSHGQVFQDSLVREQIELLENHAEPLAELVQFAVAAGGDILILDDDGTAVDFFKTVNRTQKRGFSRTGGADDDNSFTRHDREADILEGRERAEEFPDVRDLNNRLSAVVFSLCAVYSFSHVTSSCRNS